MWVYLKIALYFYRPPLLFLHIFVKMPASLLQVDFTWPQVFGCRIRGYWYLVMILPDRFHWCVTCCSWVLFQYDGDFCPYSHQAKVCDCPTFCHSGIFDTVFLIAGCWGSLFGHMEYPCVMWKFMAFSIKFYIPFLKYTCEFVLPFRSSVVLTVSHAK